MTESVLPTEPMRHPITGRFMAGDCERDCLEHCAGLCGVEPPNDEERHTARGTLAAFTLGGIRRW